MLAVESSYDDNKKVVGNFIIISKKLWFVIVEGLELQLYFSEVSISFCTTVVWATGAVLLVQLFRGVNDVCCGCSEYQSYR